MRIEGLIKRTSVKHILLVVVLLMAIYGIHQSGMALSMWLVNYFDLEHVTPIVKHVK